MERTTTSTGSWGTAPFAGQVQRSGRLGFMERGNRDDVAPELVRTATGMWLAGLRHLAFYWFAPGSPVACRVTMTMNRDGAFEYVLLAGEPVYELPYGLTQRELEVLTLLVAGLGNAEIAHELGISTRTVASHVQSVLHRVGRRTRTSVATFALDAGLLHVPLPGAPENYADLSIGSLLSPPPPAATPERPSRHRPAPARPRELVVGALVPRDGKGSDDGHEMLNGLRLAVAEINAAGGIRGRPVRTAVSNIDVTSSASIRASFESLLRGGVDVLTSGYLAAQDVAHEIAARSGVPYLHAATSGVMEDAVERDLARFGRVIQVCASDTEYAPAFVSYMTSLRDGGMLPSASDRLVVLQKEWSHLNFGTAEAQLLAARNGWHLDCAPVHGPETAESWARATATALRDPAAAVMIASFFVDDTVAAVTALRHLTRTVLAYAVYAPSVPAFRHRLGAEADGVLWAATTGTYSDATGTDFARRYTDLFGTAPGRSHAGLAYDRMHRIALAWRMTDDLSDADEVVAQLLAQPYRGVNGTYDFNTPGRVARSFDDDSGDPSLGQPQLIYQIQDGKQVIVRGGPFRDGTFRVG